MINFFVETKSEYTTQLVNVLTPIIFEGVQSIYTEALKLSNDANNVLKVFQSFLKRIPKWNQEMIKQESDRIMNNSKSYSWLPDLVKATVKANIIVLTYNPTGKNQNKIDPKYYKDIKIDDFIHKIYIECARELWNNPYLMYHQYPAIELKRNQRDTINLVKDAIKEAIRKLLPVKQILEIYLGEELEVNVPNDEFEKNISEAEAHNIQKLINKDLNEKVENHVGNNNDFRKRLEYKPDDNSNPQANNHQAGGNNQLGGNNQEGIRNFIDSKQNPTWVGSGSGNLEQKENTEVNKNEPKDLNSKILEIINKQTDTLTNSYGTPRNDINFKNNKTNNIDDKIKNILEKDLGEADLETSLSYHQETNDKDYQEIFSNNVDNANKNITNNKDKDSSKSKRKFFNNYLNF